MIFFLTKDQCDVIAPANKKNRLICKRTERDVFVNYEYNLGFFKASNSVDDENHCQFIAYLRVISRLCFENCIKYYGLCEILSGAYIRD